MRTGEVSYWARAAGSCPDLTNDLRSPVSKRVRLTGRPFPGQGLPFMRTRKPREGNGGRNSNRQRELPKKLAGDAANERCRNEYRGEHERHRDDCSTDLAHRLPRSIPW